MNQMLNIQGDEFTKQIGNCFKYQSQNDPSLPELYFKILSYNKERHSFDEYEEACKKGL